MWSTAAVKGGSWNLLSILPKKLDSDALVHNIVSFGTWQPEEYTQKEKNHSLANSIVHSGPTHRKWVFLTFYYTALWISSLWCVSHTNQHYIIPQNNQLKCIFEWNMSSRYHRLQCFINMMGHFYSVMCRVRPECGPYL